MQDYQPLCSRQEFKHGIQAALELQACPYDHGSDSAKAWLLGFKEGFRLQGLGELLLRSDVLAKLSELPAPLAFVLPDESYSIEELEWLNAERRVAQLGK